MKSKLRAARVCPGLRDMLGLGGSSSGVAAR
jgi:hypothetical protein